MIRLRTLPHLLFCFCLLASSLFYASPSRLTSALVVSPDSTITTVPNFTSITAAGYNSPANELIVVGLSDDSWSGVDRSYVNENLLLTLRAAYNNPIEWPGVTIEFEPLPGKPPVPPGHLPVYYFGQTDDTHHGQVTFEADRLLKAYSLGKDNVTGQVMTSAVPCYVSVLDKLVELQKQDYQPGPVDPQRFFFEPEMALDVTPDGTAVTIMQSKMVLKWAYIPPDTPNRTPNATAAAAHFVDCFNANYDTYAAEQAAQGNTTLYELRMLGEIAALAKWIQDKDLDSVNEKLDGVHYPWLDAYANASVAFTTTVTATPAITVSKTFTVGQSIITQSIYGGVDLGPHITYQTNGDAGQPVAEALAARPNPLTLEWGGLTCPIGILTSGITSPVDCTAAAHVHMMSKEIVSDNNFNENPPGQWMENSPFEIVVDGRAIMGGYNNAVETLKQQGSLPSASAPGGLIASSATESTAPLIILTFDWAVGPVDSNPSPADFLYVRLRRADGSLITTAHTIDNTATPVGIWQTASVNVSTVLQPYLGQTIELSFESQTNGSGVTTFYLDNVFLDTDLLPSAGPVLDKFVYLPIVLKNSRPRATTTKNKPYWQRVTQLLSMPVSLSSSHLNDPGNVLRFHLEER